MYIICVYGRSGAGKSTLSKRLAKDLGATYVDVDKYWKNVYYSDYFQKIFVPIFKKKDDQNVKNGNVVPIKDLNVSPKKAYIMRKLLVQYLNYRVNRKIRKTDAEVIVFDYIKIFDFDVFKKCDFAVFVNTKGAVCERNIINRDGLTQEKMDKLIETHVVERSDVFETVENDFAISAFNQDFEKNYQNLCKMIRTSIESKQEKPEKIVKFFKSKKPDVVLQEKERVF